MMKLYLTQHGEACSKEHNPKRPLTSKGVDDIENIAQFLKQADVRVKRIVHSGKLRAEQTAGHLAKQFAGNIEPQMTGIINPNDSPEVFVRKNGHWQDNTLIVSHLPFLARLVSYLVSGEEERLMVAFEPGSVVCLERIKDEQWVINWMIRPGLLG